MGTVQEGVLRERFPGDRAAITDEDLEFVARCMRGARRQMAVIGIVAIVGSLFFAGLAVGAETTGGTLLWSLMLLLGMAGAVVLLRQGLQRGDHPVVLALASCPEDLTGLEVTRYSVNAMGADSAHVKIRMGAIEHVVYCDKAEKHERLVGILLTRAPHLAAG